MDSLSMALVVSQRKADRLALSALPDAPVVPAVDRTPVTPRTRAVLADALRHLADIVGPPLARAQTGRPHTLCAANGSGVPGWDESR
jgi:hypothetical protein